MTPWTVARQAPLSTGFSGQGFWRGLPFVLQGVSLTQGSNLHLLHFLPWQAEDSFPVASRGFPGGSEGKASAYNAGDLGSTPGLGRSYGEGNSYPLQYSGLENSMDCIVHGVTKSWTPLGNFHFHRTVDAFAFNCYPIRWKALDVWSFIPHTIALTVSCPKIM